MRCRATAATDTGPAKSRPFERSRFEDESPGMPSRSWGGSRMTASSDRDGRHESKPRMSGARPHGPVPSRLPRAGAGDRHPCTARRNSRCRSSCRDRQKIGGSHPRPRNEERLGTRPAPRRDFVPSLFRPRRAAVPGRPGAAAPRASPAGTAAGAAGETHRADLPHGPRSPPPRGHGRPRTIEAGRRRCDPDDEGRNPRWTSPSLPN